MFIKRTFQILLFLFSIALVSTTGYSVPPYNADVGAKVQYPRATQNPRIAPGCCTPVHPNPYKPASVKNRLDRYSDKNISMPYQVASQQVNPAKVYQHQLEGDWSYVVGHVGFFHEFPSLGNSFVSIIGLRTNPAGNAQYNTQEWDRKAFWFDVGDGVPMHLSIEYFAEYVDEEDEDSTILIYNAYNLLYRQNGKDYSQTEFDGEWIHLELFTDIHNNYIDYNLLLLDDDDEIIEVRKFEPGDQVEAWTTVFLLNEPDTIYVTSMEEDFRTVQTEPTFMYEHLTPNVDFPNQLTKNLIDFPAIDLQLTLFGVNEDDDAETPFKFSAAKDMGLRWDGSTSANVMDWVFHLFN